MTTGFWEGQRRTALPESARKYHRSKDKCPELFIILRDLVLVTQSVDALGQSPLQLNTGGPATSPTKNGFQHPPTLPDVESRCSASLLRAAALNPPPIMNCAETGEANYPVHQQEFVTVGLAWGPPDQTSVTNSPPHMARCSVTSSPTHRPCPG